MIRKIVLPGEYLEEQRGRKLGTGVYKEGTKVFSAVLGTPKISDTEISVIPLAGKYIPKVNNMVIGVIKDVEITGWVVDINAPYMAYLPLSEGVKEFVDIKKVDLSQFYDIGDWIYCQIFKVPRNKIVQLSMKAENARKLEGGVIVKITPYKIPRLIGKGGSMIKIISEKTKTTIIPGQNGLVWVKGKDVEKAIKAIELIEKESYIYGLTEKVTRLLEK